MSPRATNAAAPTPARDTSLDQLCINTIRTLAMDAVQQADSGHPGTPMALAPLAYVLWQRHLRYNPADPDWFGRDRFVLSAGHACMLLYAVLYLTGYDLSLDEIKRFRQWGSRTPGHSERGVTPGVEATTGPLGQGVGNAVGMALAEAHLAALFNRPGYPVVDHCTYFLASDGDVMEGVSHEACSLAGHLKLGKLIGMYDDNRITIDGKTDLTFSDDTARRFESYGWHVERVGDGNDLGALDAALAAARRITDRPSLVIVRTHIAYGSPHKQDTPEAHGAPLGVEEVKLTKQRLGWPSLEPFHVPAESLAHWRRARERGARLEADWRKQYEAYQAAHPDLAAQLERRLAGRLADGWDADLPTFAPTEAQATRAASGKVLNAIASKLPELIGGSADLAGSTNVVFKNGGDVAAGSWGARNIHFGVREHGMGAILNGLALHGGVRPVGSTFLIFSDYMRPPIRLAALSHLPVIYVFSHDSIGLGEDGPTHQPIEQLASLRAIPHLTVLRPADATEVVEAWRAAVQHQSGPVALVLTRQKVPVIDRTRYAPANGLRLGAYVLADAPGGKPAVILMASGSEVELVLGAHEQLAAAGIAARAVSMPCMEFFASQPREYRDAVLPPAVRARLAVEAASPQPWYRWVGDRGAVLGLERFGASAPYRRIYQELGLTVENVVRRWRMWCAGRGSCWSEAALPSAAPLLAPT
ncbi:MAG: transketolase [Gemmatimonadetes bacterium 13_2_20CM_69_8]|nr:MAG: transketolase [Gemmatimonadetes bacterium 13_2_20CM_69_8]